MAKKKAHQLPRFSKSILEKPQLILESKFREISEVLENRENLNAYKEELLLSEDFNEGKEYLNISEDIGILRVEGPTTYKPSGFEALCGGCSYTSLLSQMQEFADEGVKTVLMKIESSGGQAYRMIFTATQLRKIADENKIRLIGYIDGMAASAGMGLAAACHELIANPEAEAGSIGVVISLANNSKQLEKEGIERTFITAGSEKVPFEDDGSFRKGFLEDLQENVDDLYAKFTTHIATMRNIPVQTVRDTQARMFKAEKALQLGLIDKIMEEDEFQAYLGGYSASYEQTQGTTQVAAKLTKTDEEILMSKNTEQASSVDAAQLAQLQELETLQTKLAALEAEKEQASTELANYKAKEALAAKEALEAKLDSSAWAADCKDSLVSVLLSDEVSGTYKELLNTVIASADMAVNELTGKVEEATSALATAQSEFSAKEESLKAEMNTIQEEFGAAPQTTEEALPQTDTTSLSIEEQLAINLKKLNANK
ncbi:SohB protein [Pseudoalteromonas phage J2-1]|uniref:SohB protein n=1 Tax=Pseudoalteromonas phage J2-1 TaxID=2023998 RepID=A0A223LHD6_9CAUD|nr:head maturation protease [Pseudoalteromonas phage J2-1]ASU03380.1 SohB protein [Pseudoalteromonas phage J2-1]